MKRAIRSKLTMMLREAQIASQESVVSGIPIDEITAMRSERRVEIKADLRETLEIYNQAVQRVRERGAPEDVSARELAMLHLQDVGRGLSRRDFLKGASAAMVLGAASVIQSRNVKATSQPRIVIVGAGAAGIRAAHQLWNKSGWTSTIYEWDNRVGGRIETLRNYFLDNQIAEMHGEFISSEHSRMLSLVSSFNLALDNTNATPQATADTYWFNNARYTQAQLNTDWSKWAWSIFNKAVKSAPWPTTYNKNNAQGVAWDKLSVTQWVAQYITGGLNGNFGKLCLQDVISEYGGDPGDQSALNLIYLLGYNDSAGGKGLQSQTSPVLAGTDEKWHITGGNDQIINHLVSQLPTGTIKTGQQLIAVVKNSNGSLNCTFQNGAAVNTVVADRLILALPFSTLRKVDLSKAGLSTMKMNAINNLGYGSNAKLILQTNGRPWVNDNFSGSMLTDNGANGGWEMNYQTNNYAAPVALYNCFPGGLDGKNLAAKYGLTVDAGPAPVQMTADYLAYLEQIFPGITSAYNGLAYCNVGSIDPVLLGSWSYWRVGQCSAFGGYEGVAEGNIHFAGEHTESDYQGFMEGAIRSGERVAGEV